MIPLESAELLIAELSLEEVCSVVNGSGGLNDSSVSGLHFQKRHSGRDVGGSEQHPDVVFTSVKRSKFHGCGIIFLIERKALLDTLFGRLNETCSLSCGKGSAGNGCQSCSFGGKNGQLFLSSVIIKDNTCKKRLLAVVGGYGQFSVAE